MSAKKATGTEDKIKKSTKKELSDGPIEKISRDSLQESNEGRTEVAESEISEATETKKLKATAKAGKRSAKAIAEVEEKQAKEARKVSEKAGETEPKPKPIVKPSRTRLERAGKKLRKASELVDRSKEYTLIEAIELAIKTSPVTFDATVEMHINLNVDPRHADQNVRDSLVLPNGSGKNVRVAVFAEADDIAKAKKAGADIAGSDEFLQQLDKGVIDFDVLVATPTVMAKLGKYARILGPKGLMPNPKSGTVTADVTKAVTEAKAGRVEYRVDSAGIVHLGVGKVSFGTEKLQANTQAVLASIRTNKPASIKGAYIQSIFVTTTMGPSIRLSLSELN